MEQKYPLIPRKMPVQRRSRHTVEAILTAATQVLGREGFARATTNRIAERAGVGVASVYQYFSDKGAIVRTLISRRAESNLQLLEELLAAHADDPVDLLAATLADRMVAALDEAKGALVELVLMAPVLGQLDHIKRLRQRATDLVAVELRRRFPELSEEDALQQAFVVLHSVMGVVHGYLYSNTAGIGGAELRRIIQTVIGDGFRSAAGSNQFSSQLSD